MTAGALRALRAAEAALAREIHDLERYTGTEYAIVTTGDHARLTEWRRRRRALFADMLALAPTRPTTWWPGAWRLLIGDHHYWPRGGACGLGAWRTRADAEAALHQRREHSQRLATTTGSRAAVTWCAADSRPHPLPVLFDETFWLHAMLHTRT